MTVTNYRHMKITHTTTPNSGCLAEPLDMLPPSPIQKQFQRTISVNGFKQTHPPQYPVLVSVPWCGHVWGGYRTTQPRKQKWVLKIIPTSGTRMSPLLPICCSDVSSHTAISGMLW